MKGFWERENLLYIFITLSFLYGILSYQHYSPSFHDFYIHAFVFLFINAGLFLFFLRKDVNIYANQFFWVLILFTLFIQPIFNKIIYVDGLIFPLAIIFSMLSLSIAISNLKDKEKFISKIAGTLILGAIFLQITQFFHIFKINFFVEMMRLPLQLERFSGNLFQPNQTAFIFIMAVISVMYLFREKRKSLLKYFLIFIFSLGVSFTVSRSGFLIVLFCVLIFNFFYNFLNNVFVFKLKDLFFSALGLLLGLFLYPYFSSNADIVDRANMSLEDPRISLFHRTWLIISEHPIMGVGWKNFSSAGLEHFSELRWFSSTDHSHFIFGQLLSEFGLLGVLITFLFLFIFFKNIKIKSLDQLYVFTIIISIISYSLFEFPLWQLRYLIVFSIFLSLFDGWRKVFYSTSKAYILSAISLIFCFFSLYYIHEYKKVSYLYDYTVRSDISLKNKVLEISKIEPIFGFGFFNDIIVYEILSSGNFELSKKIEVGDRLVHYIPSYTYLVRHATNLAEAGNYESSNYYFSASCHYNFGVQCERTKKYLRELSIYNPKDFETIYKSIILKYK
ncbi:Wzy polymerase domain-containing protein [Acinetobacter sp. ANC 3882]|uniref:O-antigen ligase family protein n=1 Tax=Acinetobacter sp. ANC 3882 TaxID=2923423 RepID=UPI001F4A0C26|nr:Wzy polymerase domain-containing protein [Acinetobacter sp. ANC 3882]MCH7314053.1 Wzy polymerase domain-containing protein [Acinetobacter sp. ANC 3882]